MKLAVGYNERLFEAGRLRAYYHAARYRWTAKVLVDTGVYRGKIVELGCFDGKILDWLPSHPVEYIGFDANWEGGLDRARDRFGREAGLEFHEAQTPSDLASLPNKHFDVALAMETLEHIEPSMMMEYVAELGRVTDGLFLVTVPNEMGLVFLAKYLGKKILYEGTGNYSFNDVLYSALGQSHKVTRDQHKGFDFRRLVKDIGQHFEIMQVESIPFGLMPRILAPTIGIVARSRHV